MFRHFKEKLFEASAVFQILEVSLKTFFLVRVKKSQTEKFNPESNKIKQNDAFETREVLCVEEFNCHFSANVFPVARQCCSNHL